MDTVNNAIVNMGVEVFLQDLIFLMLIYFERERENVGRGREREKIPVRIHTISMESSEGLELKNHEIMA